MNECYTNNSSNMVIKDQRGISHSGTWNPPIIEDLNSIPTGDMPGDQIKISESHISKAQVIFKELLDKTVELLNLNPNYRTVISVHGGSGVGKSEIGSLLAYYFNDLGLKTYVMSGDNYPQRIPKQNDKERLRRYQVEGIKALVEEDLLSDERTEILHKLKTSDKDADIAITEQYPWMKIYQSAGREALDRYLGSNNEIDFTLINDIISRFKSGEDHIMLKKMGRESHELWFDDIDFKDTNILILEWTHGNNQYLNGVDFPILLNSTPKETLEHRRLRNRDGGLDSPFTTMVLSIEQEKLHSQSPSALMIVSRDGEIIPYDIYERRMDIS